MISGLPNIAYCKYMIGDIGCGRLAQYRVQLYKRPGVPSIIKTSQRCEQHKLKGGKKWKVFDSQPLIQSDAIKTVMGFLRSIVGREIVSSFHTARSLEVKYVKENCGVMCWQPISKKWKFVYCNQIVSVLTATPKKEKWTMSRFYLSHEERECFEEGQEDARYRRTSYDHDRYSSCPCDQAYFEGRRDEEAREERRREERAQEEAEERRAYERHAEEQRMAREQEEAEYEYCAQQQEQ